MNRKAIESLSVQDIIDIKNSKKQQEDKPKFLTKEEREKLALQNRQNEVDQLKKAQLEKIQNLKKPLQEPKINSTQKGLKHELFTDNVKQKELELIRNIYLGTNKNVDRRKLRKNNNKKFVFDWDENEDTSNDYNPLYANKHQAQLFGRGRYAGFDELDQPKNKLEKQKGSTTSNNENNQTTKTEKRKKETTIKHWKDKNLEDMTSRDWRILKEEFNISTKGGNIPNPIRKWDESNLTNTILNTIKLVKYYEPTPIQRQAIPIQLQNRDVIGIAETGTGKTASFVIPMLEHILKLPKLDEEKIQDGPYGLILVPTRELANQIQNETHKFANNLKFNIVSIIGGHKIGDQAFGLRNGAEIVIATPGRLKDCLLSRIMVLNQCSYLVLDEADRMVDLGFEQDVGFILDSIPSKNVQTTMFSATMPPQIERIATKYMKTPAVVTIGTQGQAVDTVEQIVELVKESDKNQKLLNLIEKEIYKPPIIVFVNHKRSCDIVAKNISRIGFKATTLHGGKSQQQREESLSRIKDGYYKILVATDVAGRGIDIKNVSLVINYDMAKSIEDYTHRIGRTGRAGKKGTAITFLTSSDSEIMYDLRQMILKSPLSKVPRELNKLEHARKRQNIGQKNIQD